MRAYTDSLDALLRDLRARILGFPTVSHEDLVKRALVPTRPFVEGGRGYRDALIWYSIVEVLKAGAGDVVFVSENSRDWCGGEKDVFHSDLVTELRANALAPERLVLIPNLADFNRKYTVSKLAVAPTSATGKEKSVNYTQLLVDGKELISNQLLVALPDSLSRIGANIGGIGEFGVLGLSSPDNVRHEPPRILDSERRVLQFSAEYRLNVDLIIRRTEASWWRKNFSFQLRRDWDFDHISAYVTIPIRASFHLIEKGENTEQFSLASAEISTSSIDRQ